MRICVVTLIFSLAIAAPYAAADTDTVFFDFNTLGRFDGSRNISDYMTTEYGSSITVDGARASRDATDDTDMFIATSLQLLNRGDFEILFDETPIVGLQFEGYVLDATPGDDFTLRAFSDSDLLLTVEVVARNFGEEVFQTEWFTLPTAANRLVVSDTGRKDVGIDDLVVQPVPEPATFALMLIGAGVVYAKRRAKRPRAS